MTNHEDSVSKVDGPEATADVSLKPVTSWCGAAGSCPTVYQTNRHTVVIQGYAYATNQARVKPSNGELLVEIPEEVLLAAAEKILNAKPEP